MSAAATAAGYLYASGRLRGRNAEEGEGRPEDKKLRKRVAVVPQDEPAQPRDAAPRVKKTPRIEYKTRRRFTSGTKPDDHA